jgi:hypothetical protein
VPVRQVGLRVLITNIRMWPPSGTSTYVRDLALELQRQGHTPTVFSSTAGGIVEELRGAGIEVTESLGDLREAPDIIHGHHQAPTLVAVQHWPEVPAIYVCHDHTSPNDQTPLRPSIRRYFGVSRVCLQRLRDEGVPESRTDLLLNFVDTARFLPRSELPAKARRALVFSNYADARTHLPAVAEACRLARIELDVAGAGVGRVTREPETLLPEYDIVFAKGKAAMEAMAVGTAVVLCDFSGVGPMVTSMGFDELRPLNFGFESLREPLAATPLLREMERYDPDDAARVRDMLRSSTGLVPAVETLVRVYRDVIAEHRRQPIRSTNRRMQSPAASIFLRLFWRWTALPARHTERLKALTVVRVVERLARRVLR